MSDFSPLPDKCEAAFLAYIEGQAAADLAGYPLVGAKRHEDLPMPGVVFAAMEEGMKERLHGRGVFDVPVEIYVGSISEQDPEATAHKAAAGAILAHLHDKAAVRAALNAPASGDTRAVRDFHLYDYIFRGMQTRAIADGNWETVLKLTLICQGKDIIPG